MRRIRQWCGPGVCLAALVLLAGCGGGGAAADGVAEPPAQVALPGEPVTAPSPLSAPLSVKMGTKQVQLDWPAVEGAEHYEWLSYPPGQETPEVLATTAGTSLVHPLSLHTQSLEARFALRACNSAGCGPETPRLQPAWDQAVGKLHAASPTAGLYLGYVVALSADGSTLAATAPNDTSDQPGVRNDPAAGPQSGPLRWAGAVVVYVRSQTGEWVQQAYVKPSNPRDIASFGQSIALSEDGSTLAVGAPYEPSSVAGIRHGDTGALDAGTPYSGAAYVFTRSAQGQWSQQAHIKSDVAGAVVSFGTRVALSADGHLLAASAPNDGRAGSRAGAVHIFTRSSGTWAALGSPLLPPVPGDADFFGDGLGLSADGLTLAVGAQGDDRPWLPGDTLPPSLGADRQDNSGAVYVFTRAHAGQTEWDFQAFLKPNDNQIQRFFGRALALSADGGTLAISAPDDDRLTLGQPPLSDYEEVGAVHVFRRTGNTWNEEDHFKAAVPAKFMYFGQELALSGDGSVLAVGSPYDRGEGSGLQSRPSQDGPADRGTVELFRRQGGKWLRGAYLKPPSPGQQQFGSGVALSRDGATLAVGAPGDPDPDGSGESRLRAGSVYLY